MKQLNTPRTIAFITVCAALNAGIGFLVQLVKLPIYLDLIGSILACALLGLIPGLIAAVIGVAILGVVTTPTAFAYVGTAIIVTAAAYYFLRFGYLRNTILTIIFGIFLGVISACVSAPVTTYLFGGVSFVGADAATAYFRALGNNLYEAVLMGGILTDTIDKVLTSIACLAILRALPASLRQKLRSNEFNG
jgi:energy-coupling factor transport system substrate-specific component